MKRDLKRMYRQHGLKYLALPVLVGLLLAVVADQYVGDYLDRRAEAAELQVRLEQQRETAALEPRLRRSHEALEPGFRAVQSQIPVATDAKQATQTLEQDLRNLLQSLYFDHIEVVGVKDTPQGSVNRLTAEVRFQGVPQQLPRLQTAVAQAPRLLALEALEIKVVDDAARGGQQLSMAATFAGLYMRPLPELAPVGTKKPQGKT